MGRRATNVGLYNVLVMGVGFLFIMGGYMTTQNFATSLLDFGSCLPLGSICMACLYASFAFASVVAPAAIERLGGAPRAMLVGSVAYPLFIVSATYILTPLMLLTSLLIGGGAALLNVGQGVLMTACCDTPHGRSHNGLYNGIFMTLQQGAGLTGNLLAAFVVSGGDDDDDDAVSRCASGGMDLVVIGWQPRFSPFFALLALISAVGSCCLLRLRPLAQVPPPPPKQPVAADGRSARVAFRRTCALMAGPTMRDLLPVCCYTGLSQAFWSGLFTLKLDNVLDDGAIGRVMFALAVGEILGGVAWGAAIDRLGSARGTAIAVTVVQLVALLLAWGSCNHGGFGGLGAAAAANAAGALLGFADAGIFTIVYALLTRRFGNDEAPVTAGSAAAAAAAAAADAMEAAEAAEALLPHVGLSNLHGGQFAFTSSDAFSALMFTQSLTTGICFGVVPLMGGIGFVPGVLFVGAFELFSVACLFARREKGMLPVNVMNSPT